MRERIIPVAFFRRDPITCARELIGAELDLGKCAGKIVETEAYSGGERRSLSHFFAPKRARVHRAKQGRRRLHLFQLRRALDVERAGERRDQRFRFDPRGGAIHGIE